MFGVSHTFILHLMMVPQECVALILFLYFPSEIENTDESQTPVNTRETSQISNTGKQLYQIVH